MKCIYKTPCGDLALVVENGAVCQCQWVADACSSANDVSMAGDGDRCVMNEALRQLDEYFKGERRSFDLPLEFHGTPFREKVWHTLLWIPYGEVCSYSLLADMIGCKGGQRAVAQACSCNRLAILIPCHRVVASDGGLGGYTITDSSRTNTVRRVGTLPQGLEIKQFLLTHEHQS